MTVFIRTSLLAVSLFLASLAIANPNDDIPLWKRPKFEQLKLAETKLAEAELQLQNDPAKNPLNYLSGPLQRLGTIRTFVGDAFGAMESFDRWTVLSNRIGSVQAGDLDRLHNAQAMDAIAAIVAEAQSRQIVILNEAHQMPLHRAFAMKLARELRKIGYEFLACETCEEAFDTEYLKQSTGYYTQEPMYANFLRDAANDGWKFVHYDELKFDKALTAEQNEILRETRQASNIIAATLAHNPKAKVFIYVGHGHGMKRHNDASQTIFMTEYLQKLTNIDPLSIDQTTLYEHTAANYNHPLYLPAIQKHDLQNAFVLQSGQSAYEVFGRYQARVDIQVIHPSYKIDPLTHRYEWLSILAGLLPTDVPQHLLPERGRRVIYAYRFNEMIDAVPVDAVIVEAGKPVPKLMLPKGEFRFTFED
ncbi:hypothetical protein [Undibacterium flavidum]|uniref:Haem-binding uptake Tiki superfamily ChaN domain-containing protein n=1 Tax=Undibacterium flavidum TaxID=2762297 RepID=A0ABR6Y7B8_9BURK|nr:hypothetical protein [Undibacterium flavidum]MBC3872483.1 hypothetical protein [Undibacterium flavidum]